MILKKTLLILLTCSISMQLLSQNSTVQEDSIKDKVIGDYKISNFTPFGQGALSNFVSNFSLSSAFKEGENGRIDMKFNRNFLTAGIAVDQKIGKNDEEAIPFDLEGISSGTKVEFNVQQLFWNPKISETQFSNFDAVRNEYAKRNKIEDPRTITYTDILNKGTETEKSSLKLQTFKKPIFLNLKFAFTKSSFSFVTDSFTIAKIDKNYITPLITASVGFPISKKINNTSYIALSYVYSEKYKCGDEYDFVSPFGSSNNYFSQTLTFGEPQKKTDNKVSIECRTNLSIKTIKNKSQKVGLAPSVTYGIDSKKVGISLPIYMINGTKDDKPNGLQGGIRFGYSTSIESGKGSDFKDGFTTQLIVTLPFDMLELIKK